MLDRSVLVIGIKVAELANPPARVDVSERLLSLEISDDSKKMHKIKVSLANADLALFDDMRWRPGNLLYVTYGYQGLTQDMSGVIETVKGWQTLHVEAHSQAALMNKEKRSRSFQQATYSEVAIAIAEEYGYKEATVQHIENSTLRWDTISQGGQTDAQFLSRLAKKLGWLFGVYSDGFYFRSPPLDAKPAKVLHWYSDPNQGSILDGDAELSISGKAGHVKRHGRNPLTRQPFTASASNKETKRPGLAPNPLTVGNIETRGVVDRRSGVVDTRRIVVESTPTSAPSQAAAKQQADGGYSAAQRATVKLRLTLVFDPEIKTRQVVILTGVGGTLYGRYLITSCKHTIGKSPTTEVELSSDGVSSAKGTETTAAKVNKQKAPDADKPQQVRKDVWSERDGTQRAVWSKS